MTATRIHIVFLCASALVIGVCVATSAEDDRRAAAEPKSVEAPPAREEAETKANLRWREGKRLVDHGGHFRPDGDGAVFVSETGHELVALANLNLERVARTLKSSDEAESIRWSVNGVVTEFNGRNYLLIQRAVYKSAAPPPPPEQILN